MLLISRKMKRKLVLLLLMAFAALFFRRLSANLKTFAEQFAANDAGNELSLMLQKALYEEIGDSEDQYVKMQSDANGRITAIQVDGRAVSLLSGKLSVRIHELLNEYDYSHFGIPLGNLFRSPLLSGRGPVIPIKPVLSGNAASTVSTELQSVGINQSLHRIIITFDVSVMFLAPFSSHENSMRFDIVVAETLIVGEVPILYSGQSSF